MRRNRNADLQRFRQVLAGMAFPAAKWQLITQAEHYGADAATRSELWGLPTGSYPDLPAVFAALGLAPAPSRSGFRTAPAAQAVGRDLSEA